MILIGGPSKNYQWSNVKIMLQIIDLIKQNYSFYNPLNFKKEFQIPRNKKVILLTIDDAF